jgi:hypothetical protein
VRHPSPKARWTIHLNPTPKLQQIAIARSGDKGNRATLTVIARDPQHCLLMEALLTVECVEPHCAGTVRRPVQRDTLAQTCPTKPIRAAGPFAAGSATDQIGRAFADKISAALGQPVVVDNKPGAKGITVKWAKAIKDARIEPQ